MRRHAFPTALVLLALTACAGTEPPADDVLLVSSAASEVTASSERVIRETKNVSYSGTVSPMGISIYTEGTHRLSLQEGNFILLESDAVDLNGYVGEQVDVLGSIRPTVESDAMIMRVESISLREGDSAEESGESENEQEKPQATSDAPQNSETAGNAGASLESAGSTNASPSAMKGDIDDQNSNSQPETAPDSSAGEEEEPDATAVATGQSTPSPAFQARQKKMAGESVAPENWTQEYCSEHIGFCIPIHRNWWYKSFGATSTHYWHVEMSSEPVEELHQGPLVVELDGESLKAIGVEDGSIHTDGERVTGYRNWTNGRHFEIHADASLRDAVEYITKNLKGEK